MFNRKKIEQLELEVNKYKKLFEQLQEEYKKLQDKFNISESKNAELQDKIHSGEIDRIKQEIISLNQQKYDLIQSIKIQQNELNNIQGQIVNFDNKLYIQQCGMFDLPKESFYYQNELDNIRKLEKEALVSKKYFKCISTWIVNGNNKQGNNLAEFLAKTCITAFNLTCDSLLNRLTVANISNIKLSIKRIYDNFNKTLKSNDIVLSDYYLNLKLQELDFVSKVAIKKQQEKEEEKYQKELLKEQALADKELKKEEERLKNELLHLENKQLKGDSSEILDKSIKDIKDKLNINEYRQTNGKVGYVYIVSNPSLGKDVYKIGISRRVDNNCEERLSELSGSNIPFAFKPNCLIWSNDCFKLESQLHKEFDKYRVNKVKLHREFFKLPLTEIEKVLKEKYHLDIQINYDIIDDDFIASGWNIKENFISDRV